MSPRFVRFVVERLDPDSGRRQGVFQALAELDDEGVLSSMEKSEYDQIRKWFNENLEKPERLASSNRHGAKSVALSWFMDTATDHVGHMRTLANILESHGVEVCMITTHRPGYIVYEDLFQVAAEPFSDTET